MTFPPRRLRLAVTALPLLLAVVVQAQPNAPAPAAIKKTEPQSALTAPLFYEMLVGELAASRGASGDAYALMLSAARKTGEGRVFQRAVEIALQARAGEAALEATRAWKQAIPESRDARQFELQILIALNRIGQTVEPLRAEVAATPLPERAFLMDGITRNYARAIDKKLAASVVEQALVDDLKNPDTAASAWATVGRLRLIAGDTSGAMEAALKGQKADPASEGSAILALELIDPNQPLAEPIVTRYLTNPKAAPEVRMGYARVLAESRRYTEAISQLTILTNARPDLVEPWLLLGVLQVQTRQDAAADRSLQRYLELAQGQSETDARTRGRTQAYLLLAQLAERRKDFNSAETWLARIDNTETLVATQTRRAGLLARQGKLPQARDIIQSLPERTPEDKKQKFLAEVQLLRDAKQYQATYDMLAQASAAEPDNGDLLYDHAIAAEKLDRLDEMERLLRRLMVLKPDNPNAYNALGYSFADRNIRLQEARALIQKAVQLAPEDPFIADSLGWVEFRLGNNAEATRILEAAYKKQPDPEIGAHLGEVLWTTGDKERALRIWRESARVDAENKTLQETLKRLRIKL